VHWRRNARGLSMDEPIRDGTGSRKSVNSHGYVMVSRARKNGGCMLEHRLVMEKHLGRPLVKEEIVHHKNQVRHDNRIENLELCYKVQPPGGRVVDRYADAEAFIARYKDEIEWLRAMGSAV
jgi:hypothetical protein